jgi:hypothetical protein
MGRESMRNYPSVGIQVADILLPKEGIDLFKWATIACDQFTSEPEYWQQVASIVGDEPSTFNLILPEVFLGTPEESARVHSTEVTMRDYAQKGIFNTVAGIVYVERTIGGKTRRGLMLALDLEKYDYTKGSQSLIRATEGTIIDRLPPRIRIRGGASLEIPHILVLIDDPTCTVIDPISAKGDTLPVLYDFDLMQNSGHLKGVLVDDIELEGQVINALEKLASPEVFYKKYGVDEDEGILLFALGDGNHSLATAKAIWEKIKITVGMDHPARYALVEIENVHDDGLEFEPIHRVLYSHNRDPHDAMREFFGDRLKFISCVDSDEMINKVSAQTGSDHLIGLVTHDGYEIAVISNPTSNLPVGSLQPFIDHWIEEGTAGKIDYVHGTEVLLKQGVQPGNCGFFLPAMEKSDLFKTVILDGALPRKTFSMGEAVEKRFYMEARKIVV